MTYRSRIPLSLSSWVSQALSDLVNTLDGQRADLLSAQAFIRSAARSLDSGGTSNAGKAGEGVGGSHALPAWLATTDQVGSESHLGL